MSDKQIYIKVGDSVRGPFTEAEFKQLLAANKIAVTAFLGKTKDGPWEAVAAVLARSATPKLPEKQKPTALAKPAVVVDSFDALIEREISPPGPPGQYQPPPTQVAPYQPQEQYPIPYGTPVQPISYYPGQPGMPPAMPPGMMPQYPPAQYPYPQQPQPQQPQIIYVQAPAPAPVVHVVNNNTVGSYNKTRNETSGCAWAALFCMALGCLVVFPPAGIIFLLILLVAIIISAISR